MHLGGRGRVSLSYRPASTAQWDPLKDKKAVAAVETQMGKQVRQSYPSTSSSLLWADSSSNSHIIMETGRCHLLGLCWQWSSASYWEQIFQHPQMCLIIFSLVYKQLCNIRQNKILSYTQDIVFITSSCSNTTTLLKKIAFIWKEVFHSGLIYYLVTFPCLFADQSQDTFYTIVLLTETSEPTDIIVFTQRMT